MDQLGSLDLLRSELAYGLQEPMERGLSKAALKRLAGVGDSENMLTVPRLKPGTRLVREWRGDVHHCDGAR